MRNLPTDNDELAESRSRVLAGAGSSTSCANRKAAAACLATRLPEDSQALVAELRWTALPTLSESDAPSGVERVPLAVRALSTAASKSGSLTVAGTGGSRGAGGELSSSRFLAISACSISSLYREQEAEPEAPQSHASNQILKTLLPRADATTIHAQRHQPRRSPSWFWPLHWSLLEGV